VNSKAKVAARDASKVHIQIAKWKGRAKFTVVQLMTLKSSLGRTSYGEPRWYSCHL